MKKYKLLLLLLPLLMMQAAEAKVKLPSVFSDNMVLQQKTNAAIWGTAGIGKKVTVTTAWNGKKYAAVADKVGNWKVKVSTPSFGGPYTITISDGDITTLKNILIGDVWVCSGQSNMEMPLAGWGKIQDYEAEIRNANYPGIRLLQAEHVTSNVPMQDVKVTNGGWTACTPQYVAEFSSVAYFFAREIYKKTKVPIGLIHTSWGGTVAEAWTSGSALKQIPDFSEATKRIENAATQAGKHDNEQQMQLWLNATFDKDAGNNEGTFGWAQTPSDASWKPTSLPALWENSTLPDFDGVVWFRKKVVIPAAWVGQDLKLSLGTIDDNEITWFNGEKVGSTDGYDKPRTYIIPARLVKEADNEVVVRVFDGGGGGGIYGAPKDLALTNQTGGSISLDGQWLYKVGLDLKGLPAKPADMNGPNRPTVLYNAMIHPFIQYAIRGAIWYQGESNADRAYQYRTLFPAMIKDWRAKWGQGDFPFYFVQLANYMKSTDTPVESAWAELREAQLKTLALPNTGMASAIDIGNPDDIHPKNKQEVGRRLALIALAKTYGIKISYSGPLYQSKKISGNKITLTFKHVDGGLKLKDGSILSGFSVAGADKKFHWAKASIVGTQVIVSSDEVQMPVAVRYSWANNPNGNLSNGAGLPASPFRTDEWQVSTFGNK